LISEPGSTLISTNPAAMVGDETFKVMKAS